MNTFENSKNRILSDKTFLPDFYTRLIEKHAHLAHLFKNVNMDTQVKMLEMSLTELIDIKDMNSDLLNKWCDLSRRHLELGVEPAHLKQWMDCLIETIKAHDPDFDESTEHAWREKLDQVIAIMTLVY